jgi:hypothetical protein
LITGVCSRNNLHSVLKHIIETDNPINNYLDDEKPADELDDESIDESYEDPD